MNGILTADRLRVMLVRLEQTNAQIEFTLVMKALPVASTFVGPPKVRWWWPFGREGRK